MRFIQLKVESKTLKVITLLALMFIAWPDVAFAQQTFPIQMEGEFVCEPRSQCNLTFNIFVSKDTSNSQLFFLSDSCPNSTAEDYHFNMYSDSTQYPDSFFLRNSTGLTCFLRGRFFPTADSIYILGAAFGCGSGCSCVYEFKCKKVNSTSLSENELEAVQLFPNPVKESLQIKGLQQRLNYRLYNLQGQLLLNGQVQDGNAIELGKLAPGIYLLQLGEADKSVWHKVVKE